MPDALRWRLERTPESVRQARALITEHIADAEVAATAAVLVSEAVTSAVVHGREPIELRLRRSNNVFRVEVEDGDPAPPPGALDGTPPVDAPARWLIVDALATQWGVELQTAGRIVWFELG
jgi:anti-sigma regulatory factor (Ser/Thr protein kinase)